MGMFSCEKALDDFITKMTESHLEFKVSDAGFFIDCSTPYLGHLQMQCPTVHVVAKGVIDSSVHTVNVVVYQIIMKTHGVVWKLRMTSENLRKTTFIISRCNYKCMSVQLTMQTSLFGQKKTSLLSK